MSDEQEKPIARMSITLWPGGRAECELVEDEIVGRGMIEMLRFEFDEVSRKKRVQAAIAQATQGGRITMPNGRHFKVGGVG